MNGSIYVKDGTFDGNAGDGLYLVSSANADVRCTAATANSGYGLNATAPGSLFLKLGDLSGNTLGPMDVSGVGTLIVHDVGCDPQEPELKPTPAPPALPWAVFHVTGGDSHGLNCTEFGGTVLILPSWDHVSIPCPVTGDATLTAVEDTALPGELGESYAFVSGMDIQVEPSPGSDMLVDFLMPASGSESNMTILHWDGSAWVDRGGTPMPDNFLEISTQETGVYVLVSQ
jgi:hypothetical protein